MQKGKDTKINFQNLTTNQHERYEHFFTAKHAKHAKYAKNETWYFDIKIFCVFCVFRGFLILKFVFVVSPRLIVAE